ncbi:MAG: radical SAM family heme chaperone HemW [Blastocatellales bacterium]|nr:radical SAM family heme chaperone HemW [Blastocatellales bacterium]
MSNRAGIYIHIPFCASRCHYCNFATGGYEAELATRYVAALASEIRRCNLAASLRAADTIYFGGGTPTTLSITQFAEILDACRDVFDIAADSEITAEANPGSVSSNYLAGLRDLGVNRLSFGVQSFADDELSMIGRAHNAMEARNAVAEARAAGFDNVSIDLIAGLPEQKMDTWRRNIDEAFALGPDHLSVYLLELYRDAPLLHRIERGELRAIDEELTVDMYFDLVDEAARRGYEHYELSNWALPKKASRHNLKYWTGAPYSAFGVSAAGYDGESRWSNTRNLNEYLSRIEGGESPVAEREAIDEDMRQSEALFLGLRLKDGIDMDAHRARFGVDVAERYAPDLDRLRRAGLVEMSDGRLRIARAGKVLANEVFSVFV